MRSLLYSLPLGGQLAVSLPFYAQAVHVDNLSNQWVFFPLVHRWVQPLISGAVVALPASSNLQVTSEPPDGQTNAPGGHTPMLQFTDEPLANVAGIFVPPTTLSVSVSNFPPPGGGGFIVGASTAIATVPTNIGHNVMTDITGLSLTLNAGSYVVCGNVNFLIPISSIVTLQVVDGAGTVYDVAQMTEESIQAPKSVAFSCDVPTLAGGSVVKVQASCTAVGCVAEAQGLDIFNAPTGPAKAAQMTALQYA